MQQQPPVPEVPVSMFTTVAGMKGKVAPEVAAKVEKPDANGLTWFQQAACAAKTREADIFGLGVYLLHLLMGCPDLTPVVSVCGFKRGGGGCVWQTAGGAGGPGLQGRVCEELGCLPRAGRQGYVSITSCALRCDTIPFRVGWSGVGWGGLGSTVPCKWGQPAALIQATGGMLPALLCVLPVPDCSCLAAHNQRQVQAWLYTHGLCTDMVPVAGPLWWLL